MWAQSRAREDLAGGGCVPADLVDLLLPHAQQDHGGGPSEAWYKDIEIIKLP
ncbi:MAG: hypothetical protein ISS78_02875 [Phycisphaerae bacterium]|nr:hypothetical protein [Phycisphaerae bacterium]